jgi:hypothetical protein
VPTACWSRPFLLLPSSKRSAWSDGAAPSRLTSAMWCVLAALASKRVGGTVHPLLDINDQEDVTKDELVTRQAISVITYLDPAQTPTVRCHYSLPNQIASSIAVSVAAIAPAWWGPFYTRVASHALSREAPPHHDPRAHVETHPYLSNAKCAFAGFLKNFVCLSTFGNWVTRTTQWRFFGPDGQNKLYREEVGPRGCWRPADLSVLRPVIGVFENPFSAPHHVRDLRR